MNLLLRTALLLELLLRGRGSEYHSLHYVYTGVSEPGPGLPRFTSVGYVDGQRFIHYDSEERKLKSGEPWMGKVEQEDPDYWDQQTQVMQESEATFRRDLVVLRNRHNQSGGFHTFQVMYGCALNEDGYSGGYIKSSYEGRDFIAFDKEILTWTATDPAALLTKRRWEAEPALAKYQKAYLEEECVEWLRKYLRYGKETLLRKEPPTVKVTRKDSQEGWETLLCQAHGFYPKAIDITWRKDGEVKQDTFCGVVSPNADGTYYTWLSIEVDPKERSHYQCHVEHDGLQEPLDVAMEESVTLWVMAVGASAGLLVVLMVVLMVVAGLALYKSTKKPLWKPYKAPAPGKSFFCLETERSRAEPPDRGSLGSTGRESISSTDRGSDSSADSFSRLIPPQCQKDVR